VAECGAVVLRVADAHTEDIHACNESPGNTLGPLSTHSSDRFPAYSQAPRACGCVARGATCDARAAKGAPGSHPGWVRQQIKHACGESVVTSARSSRYGQLGRHCAPGAAAGRSATTHHPGRSRTRESHAFGRSVQRQASTSVATLRHASGRFDSRRRGSTHRPDAISTSSDSRVGRHSIRRTSAMRNSRFHQLNSPSLSLEARANSRKLCITAVIGRRLWSAPPLRSFADTWPAIPCPGRSSPFPPSTWVEGHLTHIPGPRCAVRPGCL
jgi:hypothetical protein